MDTNDVNEFPDYFPHTDFERPPVNGEEHNSDVILNYFSPSNISGQQASTVVGQLCDRGPLGNVISDETRSEFLEQPSARYGGVGGDFDDLLNDISPRTGQPNTDLVNRPSELGVAQFPKASEYPGYGSGAAVHLSHGEQINCPDPAMGIIHGELQNIPRASNSASPIPTLNSINQPKLEEYLPKKISDIPPYQTTKNRKATGPPLFPPKLPYSVDLSALPDQQTAAMTSHVSDSMQIDAASQLNSDDDKITLWFSSVEEANGDPQRTALDPPDSTIPTTVEQKTEYIIKLIRAMRATDQAEDNPGVIKPFSEKKYCSKRMEIVCWNILDACISRHQYGALLRGQKPKAPKNNRTFNTFRERMDQLLEIILTCKTICKHLLDPYFMYGFIDDPNGTRIRVRSNRTLNKKKSLMMRIGKNAMDKAKEEIPGAAEFTNDRNTPTTDATPGDGSNRPTQPLALHSTPQVPLSPVTGYNFQHMQANTGHITPDPSSPVHAANSIVGSSAHDALRSNIYNPYPSPNMAPMGNFPPGNQYNAHGIQNAPAFYHNGRPVHEYSPTMPSPLQQPYVDSPFREQQFSTTMQPNTAHGTILTQDFQTEYAQPILELSPSDMYGHRKRPYEDTPETEPSGSPRKKRRY